ncbi:MAG: hypothetical protein PHY15_01525 [Eubacteriales bacterium]|nr:hypothetical protein [Eubacteriales bacterium]
MKVYYDGKQIGQITTNRSMTVDEALEIIGVDPNEQDAGGEYKYDFELFETRYDD